MTNTILTYKIYSYSPPDILLYLFIYLHVNLYIFLHSSIELSIIKSEISTKLQL